MNAYPQPDHKPSICFVALDNFAALADDQKYGRIGGAEMQQALIGRELATRGYRVSFVTLNHGQDDEMEINGMRIIKAYDPNVGIQMLRFLHPRLTGLWRAMSRADADIYYQRTQDSTTGVVAAFCRRHRRKFVFAVASDYDCMTEPPYYLPRHTRVLYNYGLRRANLVIAQTLKQQRLLHENFGIDSTVIPNCAVDYGSRMNATDIVTSARGRRLLWIGVFSHSKRLELLLDVAEQHPDLQFDVVGDGNGESQYVQNLRSRAKTIPNVHLHGRVPHIHVHKFYQQAVALICTSRSEGFPNTFLEAWSHSLPIVSTFDPDNQIADTGLGIVAKDIPGIADGIRSLYRSPEQWQKMSRRARQFYLENYTVDTVIGKFEKVLIAVHSEPTSGGPVHQQP